MTEVTMGAVVKRLNRSLAKDGERLCATRGERWRGELGDYYAVNDRNVITAQHVDPEAWARQAGLIAANEMIVG